MAFVTHITNNRNYKSVACRYLSRNSNRNGLYMTQTVQTVVLLQYTQ